MTPYLRFNRFAGAAHKLGEGLSRRHQRVMKGAMKHPWATGDEAQRGPGRRHVGPRGPGVRLCVEPLPAQGPVAAS